MRDEFAGKARELGGVRAAAEELGVCPASFYNYLRGKTLPDIEVLRVASAKWGIKWRHMDFSEILPKRAAQHVEQLSLRMLEAVSEEDVEVVHVGLGRKGTNSLRLTLSIRLSS
jgi:hypothetical protein